MRVALEAPSYINASCVVLGMELSSNAFQRYPPPLSHTPSHCVLSDAFWVVHYLIFNKNGLGEMAELAKCVRT